MEGCENGTSSGPLLRGFPSGAPDWDGRGGTSTPNSTASSGQPDTMSGDLTPRAAASHFLIYLECKGKPRTRAPGGRVETWATFMATSHGRIPSPLPRPQLRCSEEPARLTFPANQPSWGIGCTAGKPRAAWEPERPLPRALPAVWLHLELGGQSDPRVYCLPQGDARSPSPADPGGLEL